MNYQELRDYALQCSLEHHLCNTDDLLASGWTLTDIMQMVERVNDDVSAISPPIYLGIEVSELYEYYEPSSLAEAIEDMRGVNVYNFMHVLTQVNGQEWAINFKGKA